MLAGLERPDAGSIEIDGRAGRVRARGARRSARASDSSSRSSASSSRSRAPRTCCSGTPSTASCSTRRRRPARSASSARRFEVDARPGPAGADAVDGRAPAARDPDRAVVGRRGSSSSTSRRRRPARAGACSSVARVAVLRESGVGVVYISHKLPEVLELADRITVMRGGRIRLGGPGRAAPSRRSSRVRWSATRRCLVERRERRPAGELGPAARRRRRRRRGRARAARCTGSRSRSGGTRSSGSPASSATGSASWRGVAAGLVEPDAGTRRATAAASATWPRIAPATAWRSSSRPTDNAIVHAHRRPPLVAARAAQAARDPARSRSTCSRASRSTRPRSTAPDRARQLSGGNQQRLVLGRELDESADLLVLHNPSRGLDVAATAELFRQLEAFCAGRRRRRC